MYLLQAPLLLDPARHLRPIPHTSTWRSLLHNSLAQPCLSLLVEQRPLLGPRVGVATITKSLNPLRIVTPFDLPDPLLGVAHHLGYLPHRIPNRHPPDHKQVGAQYRIGGLAVETFQPC